MLPASGTGATKLAHQNFCSRTSSGNVNFPILVDPLKNIVTCNEEKVSELDFNCVKLHKTLCLFPILFHYFITLFSEIKICKKLDVSGNLAGPVAFKALFLSLIKHDIVEELDISNGLADADCAEFVRSYISNSCSLRKLNLSGNQLGRESLARSLCVALQKPPSRSNYGNLEELNISNCGLEYMHGLFDGLRIGLTFETCCLKLLDVSNNIVRDGQQIGNDISLVLEHQKCTLKHLNITNIGLDAIGFDSVIAGLRNNHSLTHLCAGGPLNHVKNITKIKDALFASKYLSALDLKNAVADEIINYSITNKIAVGLFDSEVFLTEVNLSNCGLSDDFLQGLIPKFIGKLTTVRSLDLSYNDGLNTLSGLKELLLSNGECCLEYLNLSGLSLKCLYSVLRECESLHTLAINHTQLPYKELVLLCNLIKTLSNLELNGVPMIESDLLVSVCSFPHCRQLTKLSLSCCSLKDEDVQPLVQAICQDIFSSLKLTNLDLSDNSLNNGIFDIFSYLLQKSRYPLECLNLANNRITDRVASCISEYIVYPSCKSHLRKLTLSENYLSSVGIVALIKSLAIKSRKTGLLHLDISNQNQFLSGDEFETIAELLVNITLDNDGFSWLFCDNMQDDISYALPLFHVNLSNLLSTPSFGPCSKLLLLTPAVCTDLSKEIKASASLTDYLLFGAGLDSSSSDPTSATNCGTTAAFTYEQWESVITRQAPTWLRNADDRKRVIYLSNLPKNLSEDFLQETLQNKCCCQTDKIYFLRDCIFDEFSNDAWILCNDESSFRNVIEWYAAGKSKIMGNSVSVCSLPVSVLNAKERIALRAKNEKNELALQKKKKKDSVVAILEPSILIAEETDIYRDIF